MPQNQMFGLGGFNFQPEDPNKKWNIAGTNDLGFSGDYAAQIKRALDGVAQNQYSDAMNMAQENALASGSFNPNLSTYYASKGARDAQATAKVGAMQAGREDEYKRFGIMNAINNYNLQDKALNEQIRQAKEAEPGFWDDLFGGISTLSGIVPFLREGGKVDAATMKYILGEVMKHYANGGGVAGSDGAVMPSDYFHNAFSGYIPSSEINSAPASTGDNVMILAKDGERIIRPEGDKMTFGATQMINDSVDMIKNLIH